MYSLPTRVGLGNSSGSLSSLQMILKESSKLCSTTASHSKVTLLPWNAVFTSIGWYFHECYLSDSDMRRMGFEGGSWEHPELMVDPDSVQPSGHLTSVVATTAGVSVVNHQGVVGFQTKIALRSFTTTTIIRNLLIVSWYPSYTWNLFPHYF